MQAYLIPTAGDYNYCSCHSPVSGNEVCRSLSSNNERRADVPYVLPSVTSGNVPYVSYVPYVPSSEVTTVGDSVAASYYTPYPYIII